MVERIVSGGNRTQVLSKVRVKNCLSVDLQLGHRKLSLALTDSPTYGSTQQTSIKVFNIEPNCVLGNNPTLLPYYLLYPFIFGS